MVAIRLAGTGATVTLPGPVSVVPSAGEVKAAEKGGIVPLCGFTTFTQYGPAGSPSQQISGVKVAGVAWAGQVSLRILIFQLAVPLFGASRLAFSRVAVGVVAPAGV